MKHLVVFVPAMIVMLSACSPPVNSMPQPLSMPSAAIPALPTSSPIHADLTPPQRAAIQQLAANLGVPASDIALVSTEAVTWPNGCLGVQRIGVLCTKDAVPGYRIILSANGRQYEVHTNLDGSELVPAQAMQAPGAAKQAAVKQLATDLGVPPDSVQLVSSSPVEWPDSCIGVALQGVMCAQIVTPGYLIVLEAAGRQYEYHTNQDGSLIMPATLAMEWKEQGGIAGVCQSLTIYLSGEIYGMDCRPGGGQRLTALTAAQRTQLYAWIDRFASITIDLSDPKGVVDGMMRTADLAGRGSEQPSADDQHAIISFGQAVYRAMYP